METRFRERLKRARLVWTSCLAICLGLAALCWVLPLHEANPSVVLLLVLVAVAGLAAAASFVLPARKFRQWLGELQDDLDERKPALTAEPKGYRDPLPARPIVITNESQIAEQISRAYWASVDLRLALRLVTSGVAFVLPYLGYSIWITLGFFAVGAVLLLVAWPSGRLAFDSLRVARERAEL